jgi:hypothetical protein
MWNDFRTALSSGFMITGGGGVDSTADAATQYSSLSEDIRTDRISGLTINGPRENYDYFSQLYSMSGAATDFSGAQPASAPANGRAYYSANPITISSPWTVKSGEKIVVFVNNTLRINAAITVKQGGFLAFIVKNSLTISKDLGNTDPNDGTPIVAGVYVSDGALVIEGGRAGGDLRFVGEGTFVGWGGVSMQRQFANAAYNASIPTEMFRFRPDFMQNVPDLMTKPIYIWQETN